MARFPRRHIPNPTKPPVFKKPPNLDIHMLSALATGLHVVHVVMSGPIQGGISSSSFWIGNTASNKCIQGDVDIISGGPLTEFDINFNTNDPAGTISLNGHFCICDLDPTYAIGSGIKLRAPDVVVM